MQTVVETPMYLRAAESIFTEADLEKIVRTISANPELGDLMSGTGGYRKLRFARPHEDRHHGADRACDADRVGFERRKILVAAALDIPEQSFN